MQIIQRVVYSLGAVHCFLHQLWMDYNQTNKIIRPIFYLKWIYFRLGMCKIEIFRTEIDKTKKNQTTVYSIRCALLELWSEGTAPFEFSQLLAYRSGDMELVTKHLNQLENDNLRNLIASMISRSPADRKSAEVYLDEQRGK